MQSNSPIQLTKVLSSATSLATSVMASLIGRQDTSAISCGSHIEASTSLYSLKEVADHCDTESCWIVIHDKVYDVTHFIHEHPGGMEILLEHAGRDATLDFEEKGHSRQAYTILPGFCIGELIQADRRYKCVGD
ncbi:cytochrome b5-like [Pecten maximus]|uniref:cytochrome b5-like n=1 Tax=Pecten maximus TaxID=6579 RepID=UPI0014583BC2|nr:cytochrome b5-like [Pecten maximus]